MPIDDQRYNGVGEHTRFPIARLRYTKSTGQWAIYWRDRNLKFHEYKRKRPTKNVQALLDHIETQRRPDLLGLAERRIDCRYSGG